MQQNNASAPIKGIFFKDFDNSYIPEILQEIYIKKLYQEHLIGHRNDIIVDVGANIGITSFYFKDFAKIVYAIEPSKSHVECIDKMILHNDIKNIKVCNYAISKTKGKEKLYLSPNVTMHSLLEAQKDTSKFEEVETLTMKDFMEREKIDHIDLLKLDPEGAEGEIIGSKGFQDVVEKIQSIVGEYHFWSGYSHDLFRNTLIEYGYEFTWLNSPTYRDQGQPEFHLYKAVRI